MKALRFVRDEVWRRGGESVTLQILTQVFCDATIIDKVVFVRVETTPENPFLGSFLRFTARPSVYSSLDSIVEIRYAAHLNGEWRRFVVCKELCHSLAAPDGTYSASDGALGALVQAFSFWSATSTGESDGVKAHMNSLGVEILAELWAIEILFPTTARDEILAKSGGKVLPEDVHAAAVKFGIPAAIAKIALGVNAAIKDILG